MPDFLPGADLGRAFYTEVLAPALGPIPHGAGLLGPGSDVLGYDTARSTDHDWGPRASIFVAAADLADARARIEAALPETFRGWPVRIGRDRGPLTHHVTVDPFQEWLVAQIGGQPATSIDWLSIPQQHLLEVVSGPVFADPTGEITSTRAHLEWYPDQVWWWLQACQWHRLAEAEPFVQRTAEVGDELGSRLLVARQVRESIRLALLQARCYAPYDKWLGTAFARLDHPDALPDLLHQAMNGSEHALTAAYRALAIRHAALPGTTPLDPEVRPFWDRPALVLDADRFTADCLSQVTDPDLEALPLVGGIDQAATDTAVLLGSSVWRRRLYRPTS